MSRRFNTALIRQNYAYTVQEVCDLFGIHKNTMREWFRNGLPKTDSHRPYLIYGDALKVFLVARQQSRRKKCALNELFCFRCRLPRRPLGNLIDLALKSKSTVTLKGLCESCDASMHKFQPVRLLSEIAQTFDIPTQHLEHIRELLSRGVNSDLRGDACEGEERVRDKRVKGGIGG